MHTHREGLRFSALLLAVILCMMAFPAAAAGTDVVSAPTGMVDITSASISLYTVDGTPVTTLSNVPQDAKIDIDLSFALDYGWEQTHDIPDGTKFSLTLPSALTDVTSFQTVENVPMQYEGETYASFSISSAGVITVTFNGLIDQEGLSAITGELSVSGSFNEEAIGTGDTIEFSLKADTTYTISFEEDDDIPATPASIEKTGDYDEAAGEILWTVTVTPGDGALENVTVSDTLSNNQVFIEDTLTLPDGSLAKDMETGDYIFTLGTVSSVTAFKYRTKPANDAFSSANENANVAFENNVKLNVGGTEAAADSAIVNIKTDYIEKNGTFHTDTEGKPYILWSVDVNNNHLALTVPFTLSDTLPLHLTMSESSLTVDGKAAAFTGSGSTYTYTFTQDVTGPVRLQYVTYVDEAYYLQQDSVSFTNTATLTYNSKTYSDTVSVGVGTSLLRKTGGGYDPKTQRITWSMAVNENGKSFTNAVIEDTILPGQEFVEGSVTIQNKDDATYGYDGNSSKLTITLGDIFSTQKPVITYQTRVTNPAHTATNNSGVSYSNTATLTGVGISASTSTGTQTVKSQVLSKSGSYDYAAHRLNWTLTVNNNGMTMSSLEVKDSISSGQSYVENSMYVDGQSVDPIQSGSSLIIPLGTIAHEVIITLSTELSQSELAKFLDTNQNVTFYNNASLTSDYGQTVTVPASVTVNNRSLTKSVKSGYSEQEGTIEWEVRVNPQQVALENTILVDVLQAGLSLDTESIRLYKWSIDDLGNLSQGDLVASSAYSFEYNHTTREFRFHLPDEAQGYILQFKTDVEAAGTYSNEISLSGHAQVKGKTSSTVRVNDVSASISGKNGSITIKKVDKTNNNPITTGAIFELLDSNGVVKAEATTGSNGEVTFTKLKLRSYSIREKNAPLGYALNTVTYPVTLSGESTTGFVVVADDPLTASVMLHKTNESGKPLSGGTFAIYRSTDTATALQQAASVDGCIVFSGLTAGIYTIKELQAPSGYKRTDETRTVTLTLNSAYNTLPNVELTDPLINYPKPDRKPAPTPKPDTGSVVVSDKDNPPGTKIVIYDKDGKQVGTVTTDENGNAEFPDLPYGDYTVRSANDSNAAESVHLSEDEPFQYLALGPGVPKTGSASSGILFAAVITALTYVILMLTRRIRSIHTGKR